jgi:hypothetical protein
MLAYTAGDALNAISREHGVATTRDREELLDFALGRKVKQLAGRIADAIRQYRSPTEFDDYAF